METGGFSSGHGREPCGLNGSWAPRGRGGFGSTDRLTDLSSGHRNRLSMARGSWAFPTAAMIPRSTTIIVTSASPTGSYSSSAAGSSRGSGGRRDESLRRRHFPSRSRRKVGNVGHPRPQGLSASRTGDKDRSVPSARGESRAWRIAMTTTTTALKPGGLSPPPMLSAIPAASVVPSAPSAVSAVRPIPRPPRRLPHGRGT